MGRRAVTRHPDFVDGERHGLLTLMEALERGPTLKSRFVKDGGFSRQEVRIEDGPDKGLVFALIYKGGRRASGEIDRIHVFKGDEVYAKVSGLRESFGELAVAMSAAGGKTGLRALEKVFADVDFRFDEAEALRKGGEFGHPDVMRGGDGNDTAEVFGIRDVWVGGRGDDVVTAEFRTLRVDYSELGRGVKVEVEDGPTPTLKVLKGKNVAGADSLTKAGRIDGTGRNDEFDLTRYDQRIEIFGRGGNDIARGPNDSELLFWGGKGDDEASGEDDRDGLYGGGGEDVLRGVDGNDRVFGGRGADDLFGGDDSDLLKGGGGADLLRGDGGGDRLEGGGKGDDLFGGQGDDDLFGGGGRDVLAPGPGGAAEAPEAMTGGRGRDLFVFDPDGFAEVLDFGDGADRWSVEGVQAGQVIVMPGQGDALGTVLVTFEPQGGGAAREVGRLVGVDGALNEGDVVTTYVFYEG